MKTPQDKTPASLAEPSGSAFKSRFEIVTHPSFTEGYMAGVEDPGFLTKTQPEKIENPHQPGTPEAEAYEHGYHAAIA